MPPSMRCLLLQQTVYKQSTNLPRRYLSTSSANLYPRQRSALPAAKPSTRSQASTTPERSPPSTTKPSRTKPSTTKPSTAKPSPRSPPTTNKPSSTTRKSSPPKPSQQTDAPQPPQKKRPPPSPPKDPLSRPQTIVPLSYLPGPSNNPDRTPLPSPEVPPTLLTSTTTLLTTPPPRFLYSAPRFLHVPINTRVPEICLLGRSNVGKSTLINALAGISSAGRSHGSTVSSAKKQKGSLKGLAITSAKAGCTRTLNGYAFGLGVQTGRTTKKPVVETKSLRTRSERREAQSRNRDSTPSAALIMLDLPGYGLNSQSAWGAEIAKYLTRRAQLRGAILLIDAIAGLKEGDRQVLRILRDNAVRTSIILTKADKLGYGVSYKGEERVKDMCESVWDELRKIERKGAEVWVEGGDKGWEREIWVTGAGDPKKGGGVGVDGARFAIARMAGLVTDERDFDGEKIVVPEQRIVPFEQLTWGPVGGARRGGERASF